MKVILSKDLSPLGEEGDVKDVARGYARNYLFPRKIAVPYNEYTVKLFEARKDEIDARKQEKRQDAAGIKEKLESLSLEITMPAGPNGKLYGAVTNQTIADELAKHGHQIERKRIELAGTNFKSVGKYKVSIKLYESASAELTVTVLAQEIKSETKAAPARPPRRRGPVGGEQKAASPAPAEGAQAQAENAPVETAAPVEAVPAGATASIEAVPEAASPAESN